MYQVYKHGVTDEDGKKYTDVSQLMPCKIEQLLVMDERLPFDMSQLVVSEELRFHSPHDLSNWLPQATHFAQFDKRSTITNKRNIQFPLVEQLSLEKDGAREMTSWFPNLKKLRGYMFGYIEGLEHYHFYDIVREFHRGELVRSASVVTMAGIRDFMEKEKQATVQWGLPSRAKAEALLHLYATHPKLL